MSSSTKRQSLHNLLDKSWLSYYASTRLDLVSELYKKVVEFAHLYIGISTQTRTSIASNEKSRCLVIGACIDSHGTIDTAEIARYLLSDSISEVLDKSNRLAGSYIILFELHEHTYIITDACAMLPCFISDDGDFSSSEFLIAKMNQYVEGGAGFTMRKGASSGKSLPYTYTSYEKIHALLPNQYYEWDTHTVRRYNPYSLEEYEKSNKDDLPSIVQELIVLTDQITKAYQNVVPGKPIAALTAGWDSRLNYAILNRNMDVDETFTFMHPGFKSTSPDVDIPKQLSKRFNINHRFLKDQETTESTKDMIKEAYGPYFDPKTTIDLAYTFKQRYPNRYLLSGHIIDGVGKNHVCNAVPKKFTTPQFFQEKVYNTSDESRYACAEWLEELRDYGCIDMSADLFSIENRIARWVTQATQLYSYMEVPIIDIFNCREVLALMLRLPRSIRTRCLIHVEFFNQIQPELLEIDFNGLGKLSKKIITIWPYSLLKGRVKQSILKLRKGRKRFEK